MSRPPVVTLTSSEMLLACSIGAQIQVQNIEDDCQPQYGAPLDLPQALTAGMIGACGELAYAKWSGTYWNGNVGDRTAKDVDGVQIRTTLNRNEDLILHPRDADEDPFVLVSVYRNEFRLMGWIYGGEGKIEEYWQDKYQNDRPAFFVPRSILRPVGSLRL